MSTQSQSVTTPIQFNFNSNAIRVIVDENGEPLFLANDVCAILDYANPRQAIIKNCRTGGVSKRYTPTESGNQEMTYINEGNLYRLIIKSHKPEAEPFESWVCDEVLPSIRKTGKYELKQQLLENIEQLPEPKTKKALAGGLTLEQQDCIKALIRQRVTELPKDKQGGAAVKCWSSIKKKYGKTYKAVEPEHFTSIISLLGRLPLEGELVEPDPIQQDSITINLAPLGKGGQSRKIVMIQHESGLVDLWGVDQASDAKRKEAFIKDLVDDGYIVMKKSEMVDRLTK